jgi:hypothetical protein
MQAPVLWDSQTPATFMWDDTRVDPGFYPSVYSLWGWCQGWVYPERIHGLPASMGCSPNDFRPKK